MAGCATLIAASLYGSAPAWAVAGDATTEGTYGFVAKIVVGNLDIDAAAHACSGALVSTQWILTSASCFSNNGTPANGAPPLASTVTVGRPDLSTTSTGSAQPVVQIVSRPDRDVALARLAAPVAGVTPVTVTTTAPVAAQTLHVAGFGRTHSEWAPNREHVGDFTVQTVNTTTVQTTGTSNATLCKGDAGAPALRDAGDHVELAGVATSSGQGGCLGADAAAGHDATATRVDDLGAWISQYVNQPLPGTATDWKNARLFASGDYTGTGRSDLLTVWADGKVSLFPSDGTGKFGPEKVLAAANDRWKGARLITGGDFDGGSRFDLMVVWADGKMSNFVDVSPTGLGTEKAMTIPSGTNMNWADQIIAGRFASSAYVTDLVVLWNDGEVSLYTQTGGGNLGTEHQLLKPSTTWKDATLLTSGQFSGKTNWDLMVRWVDGELDNYPQTSAATGIGTEHRVLNPNSTWKNATVMTTGHYTQNAFVDDIVVRWTDGHTTMFADSTLDKLGTERILVPAGS